MSLTWIVIIFLIDCLGTKNIEVRASFTFSLEFCEKTAEYSPWVAKMWNSLILLNFINENGRNLKLYRSHDELWQYHPFLNWLL